MGASRYFVRRNNSRSKVPFFLNPIECAYFILLIIYAIVCLKCHKIKILNKYLLYFDIEKLYKFCF
jgi:hypothetical protein